MDAKEVDATQKALNSMLGLSGSGTVNARGLTRDVWVTRSPAITPMLSQIMDSMIQSMKQVSVPLPTEPVGLGARWKVTIPTELPAFRLTQVETYTLTELQGDQVKCDALLEQSAGAQPLNALGIPQGVSVMLESMQSKGRGWVKLHLSKLASTSQLDQTSTYIVITNGQRTEMTQQLWLKVH